MLKFETALGTCGVKWSKAGVTEVLMPGCRALTATQSETHEDMPESVAEAISGIIALLEGEPADLRGIELDQRRVSPFPQRVYAATRQIAPGTTASYGEIARAIGEPDAARAVGAALAENPFPIIVPCHRVLAATGSLHGFSAPGSITTKRRMLEIERAPGFTQAALFV